MLAVVDERGTNKVHADGRYGVFFLGDELGLAREIETLARVVVKFGKALFGSRFDIEEPDRRMVVTVIVCIFCD